MRCFNDASIVPGFGKEEIPHNCNDSCDGRLAARRKKKGMKEKEEREKLNICAGVGNAYMNMRGSEGDTYKGDWEEL